MAGQASIQETRVKYLRSNTLSFRKVFLEQSTTHSLHSLFVKRYIFPVDTRLKNRLFHPQPHPTEYKMIHILPLALIGVLAAAVTSTPFHPKRQETGQQVIFRSDLKQGEGQSPEFKDLFRTHINLHHQHPSHTS